MKNFSDNTTCPLVFTFLFFHATSQFLNRFNTKLYPRLGSLPRFTLKSPLVRSLSPFLITLFLIISRHPAPLAASLGIAPNLADSAPPRSQKQLVFRFRYLGPGGGYKRCSRVQAISRPQSSPVFPTGRVGQASVKPGPACQNSPGSGLA